MSDKWTGCPTTLTGWHVRGLRGSSVVCTSCGKRAPAPESTADSGRAIEAIRATVAHGDAMRCFELIAQTGGATCDEAEAALGLKHQTASARFNDLKEVMAIRASGKQRVTRSNRSADVYEVNV